MPSEDQHSNGTWETLPGEPCGCYTSEGNCLAVHREPPGAKPAGLLQNRGLPPLPLARARCEVGARNRDKAGTVSWVTLPEITPQPWGDTWCNTSQDRQTGQLLERSIFLFCESPGYVWGSHPTFQKSKLHFTDCHLGPRECALKHSTLGAPHASARCSQEEGRRGREKPSLSQLHTAVCP